MSQLWVICEGHLSLSLSLFLPFNHMPDPTCLLSCFVDCCCLSNERRRGSKQKFDLTICLLKDKWCIKYHCLVDAPSLSLLRVANHSCFSCPRRLLMVSFTFFLLLSFCCMMIPCLEVVPDLAVVLAFSDCKWLTSTCLLMTVLLLVFSDLCYKQCRLCHLLP